VAVAVVAGMMMWSAYIVRAFAASRGGAVARQQPPPIKASEAANAYRRGLCGLGVALVK
jgi:hypothetical protein